MTAPLVLSTAVLRSEPLLLYEVGEVVARVLTRGQTCRHSQDNKELPETCHLAAAAGPCSHFRSCVLVGYDFPTLRIQLSPASIVAINVRIIRMYYYL